MKRKATIKVVIDFGDDPTPGDRTLSSILEERLEGVPVWSDHGRVVAGRYHQPTGVIDSAYVELGEVVVP